MFHFYSFPRFSIFGAKQLILISVVALGLLINPYFAHAEENVVTSNLQAVAELSAQELGGVVANDHWTRIEFGTTYVDPIVVVEPLITNADNPYIVGIRNVDSLGFEINLKGCNSSIDVPLQETISYSVIEHSQLPSAEQTSPPLGQPFAWGECPA